MKINLIAVVLICSGCSEAAMLSARRQEQEQMRRCRDGVEAVLDTNGATASGRVTNTTSDSCWVDVVVDVFDDDGRRLDTWSPWRNSVDGGGTQYFDNVGLVHDGMSVHLASVRVKLTTYGQELARVPSAPAKTIAVRRASTWRDRITEDEFKNHTLLCKIDRREYEPVILRQCRKDYRGNNDGGNLIDVWISNEHPSVTGNLTSVWIKLRKDENYLVAFDCSASEYVFYKGNRRRVRWSSVAEMVIKENCGD